MGKPIAALAFHSPLWRIRFTANTVVWAAKYQIQGQQQAPLQYYAVDLSNGKITTDQHSIAKMLSGETSIPKWVQELPYKHYPSPIPPQ
ncbi:MAG: hypothetical protein ACYCYO_01145 [Bacilli bacterium]